MNNIIEWYFSTKKFELDGRIYEYIGIKYFKSICIYIGRNMEKIGFKMTNYFLKNNTRKSMSDFIKETRFNEGIHLFFTFLTILFMIDIFNEDMFLFIVSLICLIVNLYCIFLQRYHRGRIYKILNKSKKG